MVFRAIEGRVLNMGSVSGTDETPIALYGPTNAQRIFIENPFLVSSFEQTVINSTASGSGVVINGGGIITVNTAGQVITVSGPAFEELEGDDVDSINTLTGTVTLNSQNNATIITNPGLNSVTVDVPFDQDDVDSINTVTGTVTIDGSNGNVINTAGQTITIEGFRSEFVSASGSLQNQIDGLPANVASLNTLTGALTLDAGNNVVVTDNGTDTITISSMDTISDAIIGGVGITVTSGSSETTIDGHLRYSKIENDALLGTNGNTVISGANTVTIQGFRPEFIAASGFLQNQLDVTDVVDSLNTLTGNLSLVAGNNTTVTDNGSDEITINSFDDADVDSINTVTGTVTLQGQNTVTVITSSPTITVSGAGIASLGPGPDGLVFIDDVTRANKRLSIDRQVLLYSEDGNSDGTYLRPGNVVNNFAGWIVPRNATITAATYGYISGAGSKDFIIRTNNATDLKTTTVPSATAFVDAGLNININQGDVVQVFISNTGPPIQDAFATIELAWRA